MLTWHQVTSTNKHKHVCSICFTGIFGRPLLVALRDPGGRLCLLLRSYILHRQTSEQGCQWSRWSESQYCHEDYNYLTWSERWTDSAAGDWNYKLFSSSSSSSSSFFSSFFSCPPSLPNHHNHRFSRRRLEIQVVVLLLLIFLPSSSSCFTFSSCSSSSL